MPAQYKEAKESKVQTVATLRNSIKSVSIFFWPVAMFEESCGCLGAHITAIHCSYTCELPDLQQLNQVSLWQTKHRASV